LKKKKIVFIASEPDNIAEKPISVLDLRRLAEFKYL
jgi:hypothetical protein